uniref:NADH dehydrogenase subunit 6 n=1 Tax=Malaccina discoidalis TaxID=3035031 RepID=UPI0027A4D321|nr:NADH dehydrogenase subunit 6 [Malaccina discoidalis]WGO57402.1 NADH dehydrogenase subunit 6 [Malaccina discoidalis]
MKIMLYISMMLSMLFTQINHPLSGGIILLLQTNLIALMSGMINQTFWFSYILFLTFLGGMLVLFMYTTSLTSNEMFSTSLKMITMSMIIPLILFIFPIKFYMNNQEMMTFLSNSMNLTLHKLYNLSTSTITILMASYLFLTLIMTVKIINIFKGPLRKMN